MQANIDNVALVLADENDDGPDRLQFWYAGHVVREVELDLAPTTRSALLGII